MTNSVEPDEAARNELPHLDLHCLKIQLFLSLVLKELRGNKKVNIMMSHCLMLHVLWYKLLMILELNVLNIPVMLLLMFLVYF